MRTLRLKVTPLMSTEENRRIVISFQRGGCTCKTQTDYHLVVGGFAAERGQPCPRGTAASLKITFQSIQVMSI